VRLPRTADGGDEAGHYRRGFWVEGQAIVLSTEGNTQRAVSREGKSGLAKLKRKRPS